MKLSLKNNTFINICMCIPIIIFMWILYAFNTYNGDYEVYEKFYYLGMDSTFEIGFKSLIVALDLLGVTTYQDFFVCISVFVLGTIVLITFINTNRPFVVFLLFFIYPFFLVVELVRYSIVFCIILVAIFILMKENKLSVPIYIFLVLLATSIHTSALLFVIFIFYKLPVSQERKIKIYFGMSVGIALLSYTNIFYYIGLYLGLSSKLIFWLENHASLGMLVPIILQLFSMYVFIKTYRLSKKKHLNTKINGDFLFELNALMILLLPAYFFTSVFARTYWPILFINCLYITDVLYHQRNGTSTATCNMLEILNVIQFVLWSAFYIIPREDVWLVKFTHNSFLN